MRREETERADFHDFGDVLQCFPDRRTTIRGVYEWGLTKRVLFNKHKFGDVIVKDNTHQLGSGFTTLFVPLSFSSTTENLPIVRYPGALIIGSMTSFDSNHYNFTNLS